MTNYTTDIHAGVIGHCGTCDRPMRHKNAPSDNETVKAANRTQCHSCYARQRRGLKGPSRSKNTPSQPTTLALPPVDVLEEALCAQTDPEVFFPDTGESSNDAKAICAACPVREKCLEWALANNESFGVWGGLSARERRNLRVQRGTAA